MKRVLVTYASMAGSTADVESLTGYDGVVVGGPMIMGWHRAARAFMRRHRREWERIPLAVFVTCLSLTDTGEPPPAGVTVDDRLPKPPAQPGRLSFRKRYARLPNYLRPVMADARPAAVGVFGGRLEYGRLKPWAVLFVSLVIQAPAGDRRNWEAIRSWAAGLPEAMGLAVEV